MIPLNTQLGLPSRAFWYVALRSFVAAVVLLLLATVFEVASSAPGAACKGALCGKISGGQIAALLLLYGAFLVARAVLNFKWFTFTVTDRNISITSGVLARNTSTIRFDRIQDVNTRRDPLHALLGLKSIALWTASPDQGMSNGRRRPDGLIVLDAADADWLRDYISDPQAAGTAAPGGHGEPAAPHQGNGAVVVGMLIAAGLVVLAVMAAAKKSAPPAPAAESVSAPTPPSYVAHRGADGKMHLHLVHSAHAQIPPAPAAAPAASAAPDAVPLAAPAQPAASDYGIACAIHPQQATGAVRSCAASAAAQRCAHEGDFPSRPTAEPALLTLVNRSDESLKLYWLNYQGTRSLYATLAPGGHVDQQSHAGAHWLVASADGQCLEVLDAATMKVGIF
ncbi:MAG TPA: PH domain-containing protein [Steroidobacteraceae bacterium]|jgi:membrane protein YdbS with pleckstrin-like domain|nr:PH domain-containing protein [Steroidobacteraceae bacterium]